MRRILLSIAFALGSLASPAQADDRADIIALEAEWSRAFLAADYASIERIVAPEFQLLRVEANGAVEFTPRDRWLANARRLAFEEYEARVVDVVIADDSAVATIEGRWKISMAGRGSRDERFVLTDALVRRGGAWRVIFRHSRPIEPAPASR